jgi:hypothetical protein
MIPDRVNKPKPHEPAEQKIELQTLHQLAFETDGIEGLQQQRPQQLLWDN